MAGTRRKFVRLNKSRVNKKKHLKRKSTPKKFFRQTRRNLLNKFNKIKLFNSLKLIKGGG